MGQDLMSLQEVLKLSLDAAAGEHVDVSCAAEREQVFQILPGLFLGSEFGASNPLVIDSCNIRVIINLTSGHAKIPNQFEKCRYVNYELVDQPGEDILSFAIREGVKELDCMEGTSRKLLSLTDGCVVVAYVMCYEGRNLSQAVDHVTRCRGRRLRINPSFWMAPWLALLRFRSPVTFFCFEQSTGRWSDGLSTSVSRRISDHEMVATGLLKREMPVFKALAQWERELQENDSAMPTFDFTDWWIEAGWISREFQMSVAF
eukprot:s1206_g23.t2